MNDLPEKLAKPAQRALASVGIDALKMLTEYTEQEVAELHGIGQNALKQLKAALEDKGLNFKQ